MYFSHHLSPYCFRGMLCIVPCSLPAPLSVRTLPLSHCFELSLRNYDRTATTRVMRLNILLIVRLMKDCAALLGVTKHGEPKPLFSTDCTLLTSIHVFSFCLDFQGNSSPPTPPSQLEFTKPWWPVGYTHVAGQSISGPQIPCISRPCHDSSHFFGKCAAHFFCSFLPNILCSMETIMLYKL
jgi:hypothetical protein